MIDFKTYINELQSVPINEITEHSKRFALETLLRELAVETSRATSLPIKILHEPRRKDNFGAPDFKIYTDNSIIGYVENKKISENLDKILKSDQIIKYRELSQNILLTNYIDFVWIKGDMIQRETLCYLSDIENKKFQLDNEKALKVEKLIINFYSEPPIGIANAKDLALSLAIRGKNLKDFLNDELVKFKENDENNDDFLFGLYKTFKSYVFKQLTISEFSDAFAQMLVYGLFLAKLNADTKTVSLENAKSFIPQSFQLIKELVSFLDKLDNPDYSDTKWIIDETISIMNNLDLPELKKSLLFSNKVKDNENIDTDPYIYFYETFLAAYDSNLRKAKGVYYTPPQVVNFIIRAINDILKSTFNISSGFAAPDNVTVLDFATGTGTFLIEILKQIFDTLPANSNELKKMLIKDHILKNLYGFEYLIAPYTIAHLKLSQFLKENGYDLKDQDRFQLFLTNTLEPIADIPPNIFVKTLSKEGKLAQQVKDKPILVITGNPPYSGHSKNTGDWITNLLKGKDIWAKKKLEYQADYYSVDGNSINEKNSKWLQDDYVKFIRFAQYKIDNAGEGVVGIITNHSFLDNPTFKGMRQSLMTSFDQLYFIDLHGNTKKQEKTPEGKPDKNVFDIEQGVAISIMIKKKGLEKKVFHADIWSSSRKQKFEQLLNNSLNTIDFVELKPKTPYYLFIPQNYNLQKTYDKFIRLQDIFLVSGVGICSKKDDIVYQSEKNELINLVKDFINLDESIIRQKYNILTDNEGWKLRNAKTIVSKFGFDEKYIKTVLYRPFDLRYTYYLNKGGFMARPVYPIFKHLLHDNINLIVSKINRQVSTNYSLVSNVPADLHILDSARDATYNFPLYLYNAESIFKELKNKEVKSKKELLQNLSVGEQQYILHKELFESIENPDEYQISTFEEHTATYELLKQVVKQQISTLENTLFPTESIDHADRVANISPTFIKLINEKYEKTFSPEKILGYVYAILQCPTYQVKYAEFFKIDFPKIPLCDSIVSFEKIADLGYKLIQNHLLNEIPCGLDYDNLGLYQGDGDNIVIKPEHKTIKTDEGYRNLLYINKTQFFENVPENIYNFYIGGYQVLDKYLKERKNKKLVLSDILNIGKTIKIIAFTIKQMELIDNETREWI